MKTLLLSTPAVGLLVIPLGVGICLRVSGHYKRWADFLTWGPSAALTVAVLNSIQLGFLSRTFAALIAIGAVLLILIQRDNDDSSGGPGAA